LYRYDCVIVPDFGAFLTQRKSAQIYAPVFHAPSKAISFNEQVQHNDGLLVTHIAKNKQLTYEDALIVVQTTVRELKARIANGAVVTLNQIGELSLNTALKLTFSPSGSVNYLTDSFGLASFVSQEVTREVLHEQVHTLEQQIPELIVTSEKRKNRSYLKYAAAFLVLIGGAGLVADTINKNNIAENNTFVEMEAQEAVIQEASFQIGTMPAMTLELPSAITTSGRYHVVAGAFRVEENAEKKIALLKAANYNPSRIGTNKYGLHQVVYLSTDDAQEALNALKKIRANDNESAWLLVKDLN
jgi:hypothetical protein